MESWEEKTYLARAGDRVASVAEAVAVARALLLRVLRLVPGRLADDRVLVGMSLVSLGALLDVEKEVSF